MRYTIGFFLGLIITLFILDFFVTKAYIFNPLDSEYDENFEGILRRKNFTKFTFNEGFGIVSNDSNRSRLSQKTSKDSISVFFFGDSFVEAEQVFDRDHFISVFNNLTNNCYRSYNYGRTGFDLPYMYILQNYLVRSSLIKENSIQVFLIGTDDLVSNNN